MPFDAHARPPEPMKVLFKTWQKCSIKDIDLSGDLVDFHHTDTERFSKVCKATSISRVLISKAFEEFLPQSGTHDQGLLNKDYVRYELRNLPGLFVYPFLISHEIQVALLDKILHRDLSDPAHQSNLHLHYKIEYPGHKNSHEDKSIRDSFFLADGKKTFSPKDPAVHKPISVKQMLERKLRWVTLGGQYDWTAKLYPSEPPPKFPEDIGVFLKGMFPNVDAQAAIVNFYTPGDTLSVHRDVSEHCDRGLISISIGCDGIFIIGDETGNQSTAIRLRSGDVVLMSGKSRYAWHAVPRIIPGTCPQWLQAWPASNLDTPFEPWKGWMANKRINLNVRQMRAESNATDELPQKPNRNCLRIDRHR